MARAVRRDEHKMHAFVRFREVGRERKNLAITSPGSSRSITSSRLAAPFFAKPFRRHGVVDPDTRCSARIGTGDVVSFTEGVSQSRRRQPKTGWRKPGGSYYASIFNPARLKVKAMQNEMPKKYWRNLPEASLIKPSDRKCRNVRPSAMIANVRERNRTSRRNG